jgi:hypothetical protein
VSSVFVVVAHIFCKQPFQVGFVECDYVVQQIAAATFHPSFCHTVLPWAFGPKHRELTVKNLLAEWRGLGNNLGERKVE